MAAYNWLAVDTACPACESLGTLRAQTHVGASFAGDEQGRFCHATYRVGERMRWYPPEHARYATWRAELWTTKPDGLADNEDIECCTAECSACASHELWLLVRFRDLAAVEVLGAGTTETWPKGYG